jgi:universal stress protein A
VTPFTHILVATDFGPAADRALACACELAKAYSCRLQVLHVVDDLTSLVASIPTPSIDLGRMQTEMEEEAMERLRALIRRECPTSNATPVILTSHTPAFAILSYARDEKVDLIVAGTHGRSGFSSLFIGSVAQKLVRSAPCPVLTVHAPVAAEEAHPAAAHVVVHK